MTSLSTNRSRNRVAELFQQKNKTIVMGVLNVTPDSFSDGGRFFEGNAAVGRCREMIAEGADIIDIGGESSRPGSAPVSADEELRRIMPVLERVLPECPIPISVDTYKSAVAEAVLVAGAAIINDITALHQDRYLAEVVARFDAGLILMHMRGTPSTMQSDTNYGDLIGEIRSYLAEAVGAAETAGVKSDKIMIDPGVGFGKDVQGNLDIVRKLGEFMSMGKPVMVGASRKSFIGKITGAPVDDREPGSLASAVAAVLNGASAVRVHDVAAARQAVDIAIRLRTE